MAPARVRGFRVLVAGGLAALSVLQGVAWAEDVPAVVRLGWVGGPRPWILGKAEGLFEKRLGTRVEWVQFQSGGEILTGLAAKAVDISRLGSAGTVAGMVRKLPIELIAISGVIATSERLIARQGIDSVKALEGKRVAYPPGSTAHYTLMAALKVAKVDIARTKLLGLAPTEMVAAWKRGDIDAGYVWGPFSHQMEADNGRELLASRDLQKDGYLVWNDYVMQKEFGQKYPSTVVKFLQTFEETVMRYKQNPDETARLIAAHLNQKFEFARDTMAGLEFLPLKEQLSPRWLGNSETKATANITKAMADSANFLAELGDLRRSDIPASFAPFINTTYMERAVAGT